MRRRRLIELLVVRWGFTAMVGVAVAAGVVAATTVATPAVVRASGLAAEEDEEFEELTLELMEEVGSLQAWRKEMENGNQGPT